VAEQILIDTGPLVALLDSSDQHHQACAEAAKQIHGECCTAWPVITEACYLLRKRPDLVEELLGAVYEGDFRLLQLAAGEVNEVGGWVAKYRDQEIDLADACLAHLAEREGITTVFTVDRRHFELFRLADGQPLTLLPRQAR